MGLRVSRRANGGSRTRRACKTSCLHACSCYRGRCIGLPPAWYKSPLPSRIVREPAACWRKGLEVAPEVEVKVWDSSAEVRYLVLPERPPGTAAWSEEKLAALVTRDAMIGTARPLAPEAPRPAPRRERDV